MTPTSHSNRHFDGIPEDRRYLHGLWLAPYSLPLAGSTPRSESSLGGKYSLCGQWAHWNHRTGQRGSYVGQTGVHPDPLGRGDRARRGQWRTGFSLDINPPQINFF